MKDFLQFLKKISDFNWNKIKVEYVNDYGEESYFISLIKDSYHLYIEYYFDPIEIVLVQFKAKEKLPSYFSQSDDIIISLIKQTLNG